MSVHFIIRKINRHSLNPCHAHFILICIESIFKTRYVHIDGPNLLMNTKKSQQTRVTKWNKISRIRMSSMKRISLKEKKLFFWFIYDSPGIFVSSIVLTEIINDRVRFPLILFSTGTVARLECFIFLCSHYDFWRDIHEHNQTYAALYDTAAPNASITARWSGKTTQHILYKQRHKSIVDVWKLFPAVDKEKRMKRNTFKNGRNDSLLFNHDK